MFTTSDLSCCGVEYSQNLEIYRYDPASDICLGHEHDYSRTAPVEFCVIIPQSRHYLSQHCRSQSFIKCQAFHMRVNKSPVHILFFLLFHFHTCQLEAIAFNLCIKATEENKHSLFHSLLLLSSSPLRCLSITRIHILIFHLGFRKRA